MKEDEDIYIALCIEYTLYGTNAFTVLWWNTSFWDSRM